MEYSHQAYSLSRQKINYSAFIELSDFVASFMYKTNYKTYKKYIILAIDGSKIQLPSGNPKLRTTFGTFGAGKGPAGQSSTMYDTLNDVIIDAKLRPISYGERKMAVDHIEKIADNPFFENSIVLFDRGYPSYELIEFMKQKNVKFIMRLKSKFNNDIDRLPIGMFFHKLQNGVKSEEVKVVKFYIGPTHSNKNTGESTIETLITNVYDQNISIKDFKNLYHLRWPIETMYNKCKQKLQLENFSGHLESSIMQDYHINIFYANLTSLISKAGSSIIDQKNTDVSKKNFIIKK
jgi:hypothetical protein